MNTDVIGNACGAYIYIWLILRNEVPNESIMVGEVNKDCTVQAYQHGIPHFKIPMLLCLWLG